MNNKKILIMAGGTGGHIFPALATAEILRQQGVDIQWLGTPDSMEERLVPGQNIRINYINITGVRGKGIKTMLKTPFKLIASVWQAIKILRQYRPDCVLGMGGYASGPGGIAARLLRIPLIIHEQNAVVGMTNKYLSKISNRVLEAFPGAFPSSSRAVCTGNPVRGSINSVSHKFDSDRPLRLLVVGGSLGAIAINDTVPVAIQKCKYPIDVWHQTGWKNIDRALELYSEVGVQGRVDAFIENMAEAYQWADLVVCRAGALTVAELANVGKPSILIPFPYAVDDHQTKNAEFLAKHGAAELVNQNDLTAGKLTVLLQNYSENRQLLQIMAKAALAEARPCAATEVAHACMEVSLG